jgi:hypothetical protein
MLTVRHRSTTVAPPVNAGPAPSAFTQWCARLLAPVLLAGTLLGALPAQPAAALPAPVFPGWLKAGLVLHYSEQYDNSTIPETTSFALTDTVISVTASEVTFSAHSMLTGGNPATCSFFHTCPTKTYQCSVTGSCSDGSAGLQFWVDPANPLASVKGHDAPFVNMGVQKQLLTDAVTGQKWRVAELYVDVGAEGGLTRYQWQSGLVVQHDEWQDSNKINEDIWYVN